MFNIRYIVPTLYCLAVIIVYMFETVDNSIKETFAILPRDPAHLKGIFTSVFIHDGLEHLSSNFIPLVMCMYGLFYFYRGIAMKVTVLTHLVSGLLVWLFARNAYHMGASGMIYSQIFFVLVSALIKRNKQLTVFAFIILVFQGGLMWGLMPQDNGISWESHLYGALTGAALAFIFRHQGPPPDMVIRNDHEEEDEYLNVL